MGKLQWCVGHSFHWWSSVSKTLLPSKSSKWNKLQMLQRLTTTELKKFPKDLNTQMCFKVTERNLNTQCTPQRPIPTEGKPHLSTLCHYVSMPGLKDSQGI